MWTEDNTEGFTAVELSIINTVLERVFADTDIDESNINDAINNAWVGQSDASELEADVRKRLGIA